MTGQGDILHYQPPRRLKLYGFIALIAFLLILIFGLLSRMDAARRLAENADASTAPIVAVITPSAATQPQILILPGAVKAFNEAPIYAQVSGYLQNWQADIGTPVQAGQVLATIATPNLDQQLAQAQANLAAAAANEQIAAVTAKRWDMMRAQAAVSQQDTDDKDAQYQAARAAAGAARAAVEGLQAQEAFKHLVAPFSGTVTARNTDIGALITPGTPGQTPLFMVDDETRLRIYVSVPQAVAAKVRHAKGASFTVLEYPGRVFHAMLAATSGAIDPGSGTMLVQFQFDNKAGLLQPGDYAQVQISLPPSPHALSLPASALMFRDSGMAVAALGPDGRVIIKPVTIIRDLGSVVQIADGISKTDRIINNPPDALEAGDVVRIATAAPSA